MAYNENHIFPFPIIFHLHWNQAISIFSIYLSLEINLHSSHKISHFQSSIWRSLFHYIPFRQFNTFEALQRPAFRISSYIDDMRTTYTCILPYNIYYIIAEIPSYLFHLSPSIILILPNNSLFTDLTHHLVIQHLLLMNQVIGSNCQNIA